MIDAGVPKEAAEDFLMGHFQIGIAIIFQQLNWRLSAGAQMALEKATARFSKTTGIGSSNGTRLWRVSGPLPVGIKSLVRGSSRYAETCRSRAAL